MDTIATKKCLHNSNNLVKQHKPEAKIELTEIFTSAASEKDVKPVEPCLLIQTNYVNLFIVA